MERPVGRSPGALWFRSSWRLPEGVSCLARYGREHQPPSWLPIVILLIGAGSFVEEFVRRQFWTNGRAWEVVMLCGFRNAMLAAAAGSLWRSIERVAAMLSLFLLLFAAMAGDDPFLYVVLLAYTVAGVWWLMSFHWGQLAGRLPDEESRMKRPVGVWVVLPLLLVGLIALVPLSGESVANALPGFMPSSGGQGQFDPYARRGVGDGDMLVAGTKNVQSFAPIDEAPFLDSDKPSLYDVFNDTYDEPVMPKNQDRAIALPPELMQEATQRMAESQMAGRQFSTLRKAPKPRAEGLSDRTSEALFFIAGRVPLHLRMETYDVFDGIEWYPETARKHASPVVIRDVDGKRWVDLSRTWPEDLPAHPETHALKIGKLKTNRIPSPPQLIGLHIDKVDRPDLFGWATPDILKMDRRTLPSLMVAHLQSRVLDRDQLVSQSFAFASGKSRYRVLPKTFAFRHIQRLAEQWTEGLPRGWAQIVEIERKLRENYLLDPAARCDENCICPVAEFLYCSKRGPDYQFATAAAVMLRSLGYSARVVSGFYADPENFDARSRHTLVHSEDVHFWAEVSLDSNTWITLEPTPGYEVLAQPPTWGDRVLAGLALCGDFVDSHKVPLGLVGLFLIAAFVARRRLLDCLETLYCLIPISRQGPRERILRTLRLLDHRRKRLGWSRPCGVTPTRWLKQLAVQESSLGGAEWTLFIQLAEQAAFDTGRQAGARHSAEQLESLCDSIRKSLCWQEMKRLARAAKQQVVAS